MTEIIEIQKTQEEGRRLGSAEASAGLPELFRCLLGSLESFYCAAKREEPQNCLDEMRGVSSPLCAFLRALVPAAPADVINDIAYIIVLYLLKGSMHSESQTEHGGAEETQP